jgi:hypothetical protein
MRHADYHIAKFFNELRLNIEAMPAIYWVVLGVATCLFGILFLRGNKNVYK